MITVSCAIMVMFRSKTSESNYRTYLRESPGTSYPITYYVLSLRGTPGFAFPISSETNQFDQEW